MLGWLMGKKQVRQQPAQVSAPAHQPKKQPRRPKRSIAQTRAPMVIAGKLVATADQQAGWVIAEAQARGLGGSWICSLTAKLILDEVCKARGASPLGWRGPSNVPSALAKLCEGKKRPRNEGAQPTVYRIPQTNAPTVIALRVVA